MIGMKIVTDSEVYNMTTKIKILNNRTNIQDMFLDLMYSDSPVKYISGLHPEWSITKTNNGICAYNENTKQVYTIGC